MIYSNCNDGCIFYWLLLKQILTSSSVSSMTHHPPACGGLSSCCKKRSSSGTQQKEGFLLERSMSLLLRRHLKLGFLTRLSPYKPRFVKQKNMITYMQVFSCLLSSFVQQMSSTNVIPAEHTQSPSVLELGVFIILTKPHSSFVTIIVMVHTTIQIGQRGTIVGFLNKPKAVPTPKPKVFKTKTIVKKKAAETAMAKKTEAAAKVKAKKTEATAKGNALKIEAAAKAKALKIEAAAKASALKTQAAAKASALKNSQRKTTTANNKAKKKK